MKSIYILITLFIIALSTLAGACQRHKNTGVTSPDEQAEIKMLKQEIHDSIRTFNVNFAKEAILKGKNVAKDSDDYYDFVLYDVILLFYMSQPDSMLNNLAQTMDYLSRQPATSRRNHTHPFPLTSMKPEPTSGQGFCPQHILPLTQCSNPRQASER